MVKKNSALVKQQNKINVFRYLLKHSDTTKPEISVQLGISIPTVGQILTELIDDGFAFVSGEQESSGGRRATTFSLEPNSKKALGINVTAHHVEFILLNLASEIIAHNRIKKVFHNSRSYLEELNSLSKEFIQSQELYMEDILGIGIAFPGIIEGTSCLTQSHALRLENPLILENGTFENCSVTFFNDATAACMAELYGGDAPENFIYISLSDTVGGASVAKNSLSTGDTNRNGEIGHLCVRPMGKRCYCGKNGHYDPYGNAKLLKKRSEDGTVEGFLSKLKSGDKEQERFFDEYLDNLALLLSNLHMLSDSSIIIGGYVSNILGDYLDVIREKVRSHDIFSRTNDYIFLAKHGFSASAKGAAGFYIHQFIEEQL